MLILTHTEQTCRYNSNNLTFRTNSIGIGADISPHNQAARDSFKLYFASPYIMNQNTNKYFIDHQEVFESSARSYPRKFPFALTKAKGTWVEDVEGNQYLDFLAGAGTLALGHNDPEVSQAMIDLIQSGATLHTLDLMTPMKDEFVSELFSIIPEELAKKA